MSRPEQRPPQVFLSYSRDDTNHAAPLVALLKLGGREVFWDQHSIAPGEDWAARLEDAVRSADEVVVLWCCHAAQSEWVARELAWATDSVVALVPVLLCKASAPPAVGRIQWIDMSKTIAHRCERTAASHRQNATEDPSVGWAPEVGRDIPDDDALLDDELARLTRAPTPSRASRPLLSWFSRTRLLWVLVPFVVALILAAAGARFVDMLNKSFYPIDRPPPSGELDVSPTVAVLAIPVWCVIGFVAFYRAKRRSRRLRAAVRSLPHAAKPLGFAVLNGLLEPTRFYDGQSDPRGAKGLENRPAVTRGNLGIEADPDIG